MGGGGTILYCKWPQCVLCFQDNKRVFPAGYLNYFMFSRVMTNHALILVKASRSVAI